MIDFKKGTVIFLLVVVLSFAAVSVMATNGGDTRLAPDKPVEPSAPLPIGEEIIEVPSFKPFTGTVKEIRDAEFVAGSQYVFVETDEGKTAYLIVTEDTYFVNDRELMEGSVVTGYFDENLPIIMIYPPQYGAVVMIVEPLSENIKVDRFDDALVSSDNSLKLNITDETEIILQDGKPFTGELANRDLVVTYDVSTRSIPAQTTPLKVVVLFEKADSPVYDLPKPEGDLLLPDVELQPAPLPGESDRIPPIRNIATSLEIVVENRVIEAPAPFYNQDNMVMLPLRAIAEALGFNVSWNAEKQLVMLGDSFTATIGQDAYVDMSRDEPIALGAAPELMASRTYVPLQFFRDVIAMNNAYVFEAQIVIDNNEEIMH